MIAHHLHISEYHTAHTLTHYHLTPSPPYPPHPPHPPHPLTPLTPLPPSPTSPHTGISFYSYACIKDFAFTYLPEYTCTCDCTPDSSSEHCTTSTDGATRCEGSRLKVAAKLICGGLAGAIAQTIA